MTFEETRIPGAFIVGLEPVQDERGSFARTFCEREFAAHGIEMRVVQTNVSRNRRAGTLRGMHYSVAPAAEQKIVRCIRGRIYDVLVDLRSDSNAHGGWAGVELTPENGRAVFVPRGVAHGFITLDDHSEVEYFMSELYDPACARGVRWDDPAFGIVWPRSVEVISDRDAAYSLLGGPPVRSK